MGHDNEARLGALTIAMHARTPQPGAPTIADLPHGPTIAKYLLVVVTLEHSRDPADQQRVRCAALRAGALMPRPGHPGHPDAALLGAIRIEEETGADVDDGFWALVGVDRDGDAQITCPAPRGGSERGPNRH